MHEQRQPFFNLTPYEALNQFSVDNLIGNLRIKHDVKTGSGRFFKIFRSYQNDRRYIALFGETTNIFLYPPNATRDFWILKIEANKKEAAPNGTDNMGK